MRVNEHWLREWVNPSLTIHELAEQLTMAGLEIESITPVAGKFSKVIVGNVLAVAPHPDAERLRVCQVDVGLPEQLTIVCGAANVRAGLKVPVAMVGAVLPGGMEIKAAKLRGVFSQGMICSVSELGLEATSQGIMELAEDAPIGADFRDWLKLEDVIIDVHVTPNRGDCLSVAGVAREIALLNQCPLTPPAFAAVSPTIKDQFPITISAKAECPRYLGRIIRGINPNAQTPMWLSERLRRCGMRSVHPVVDVTNYILMELGQPQHAFDLAKLKQGIVVRMAKKDERLILLDGKEVSLDEKTLVIADNENALAIAGVKGGEESSVNAETIDIFLETAFFNPISIGGVARRYGLETDGAYRFERGVDPNLQRHAMERATQLLLEIVGGQAGPIIETENSDYLPKSSPIRLRQDRIERLLGTQISAEKIETVLHHIGATVEKESAGNNWKVLPPSYRYDLTLEEDLIEEVARVEGYHNLPQKQPHMRLKFVALSEQQISLSRLRNLFIERGYQEAITYSFVAPKFQKLVHPDQIGMEIINPISADLSVMRTSLWPGLLNAVAYNQNRQQSRVRLFETGLRFLPNGGAPVQEAVLAGVVSGNVCPEQWGLAQRPVDFFDVKGDLEALFKFLGKEQDFTFQKGEHPALHPGQSSAICCQGNVVGYLGALHPRLFAEFDVTGPLYLFGLDLKTVTNAKLPLFAAFSKFPSMRRDISFLISAEIPLQQLFDTIRQHAGEYLIDLNVFDVYQGKNMEEGMRSLALGIVWQHPTRTFTDDEVNAWMEQVLSTLKQAFAIRLRE